MQCAVFIKHGILCIVYLHCFLLSMNSISLSLRRYECQNSLWVLHKYLMDLLLSYPFGSHRGHYISQDMAGFVPTISTPHVLEIDVMRDKNLIQVTICDKLHYLLDTLRIVR